MYRDRSLLLMVKLNPSPFIPLYLCSIWLHQQLELGQMLSSSCVVMLAMLAPFQNLGMF